MVTLHKRNTAVGAPDDRASNDIALADEAFTLASGIAKRANDTEESRWRGAPWLAVWRLPPLIPRFPIWLQ